MTDTRYYLRRLHAGLLTWHSYKTKALRATWAAKYRANGDSVWVEGEDTLLYPSPGSVTSTAATRTNITVTYE